MNRLLKTNQNILGGIDERSGAHHGIGEPARTGDPRGHDRRGRVHHVQIPERPGNDQRNVTGEAFRNCPGGACPQGGSRGLRVRPLLCDEPLEPGEVETEGGMKEESAPFQRI